LLPGHEAQTGGGVDVGGGVVLVGVGGGVVLVDVSGGGGVVLVDVSGGGGVVLVVVNVVGGAVVVGRAVVVVLGRLVVLVCLGDVAACAGTMTDSITGRTQRVGRSATPTMPPAMAACSTRRRSASSLSPFSGLPMQNLHRQGRSLVDVRGNEAVRIPQKTVPLRG
jgi:hypothetical protein